MLTAAFVLFATGFAFLTGGALGLAAFPAGFLGFACAEGFFAGFLAMAVREVKRVRLSD